MAGLVWVHVDKKIVSLCGHASGTCRAVLISCARYIESDSRELALRQPSPGDGEWVFLPAILRIRAMMASAGHSHVREGERLR